MLLVTQMCPVEKLQMQLMNLEMRALLAFSSKMLRGTAISDLKHIKIEILVSKIIIPTLR